MTTERTETGFRETAQPDAQPTSATGETVWLSVPDAAALLHISPQAVRKRIAAGKLSATQSGRAWLIRLDRATNATSATATGETPGKPRATSPQPSAQPGANLQTMQTAAMIEAIQAPLLDRIEAAIARAERAELERDQLRADLERFRQDARSGSPAATTGANVAESTVTTTQAVPRAPGRSWRFWRGRSSGGGS